MHPTILAISGYTLLLSSLVSLVILLKKNINRCVASAVHLLTMSDILSSLLTGILLIYNQYSHPSNKPFGHQVINNTFMSNKTWMELVNINNEKSPSETIRSFESVPDNDHETYCNFGDVVMHYAMFIFPFANAFVSLLSFSARSTVDLNYVSSKCGRFIDTSRSKCKKNTNYNETDRSRANNEMKVTGLGIAGQWIIPMLLTAVLQFAGHEETKNINRSQEANCIYGTNFPFENCYATESSNIVKYFNRTEYTTTSSNNYIETHIDPISKLSEENSTDPEITGILAKIYHIVESARNSSGIENDTMKVTSFYDASQLLNITKFKEKNETAGETIEDFKNSMKEETSLDFRPQVEIDSNAELQLFDSLMKNSSEILDEEPEYRNDESETEELDYTDIVESQKVMMEPVKSETTTLTDKEIYADIVKKIQSVSTQFRVRDKLRESRVNEQSRMQKNFQRSENFGMFNREDMPECMKNQCFLSTSFIKVHLLILIFLVYFLPIFFTALIHMRARYECRNMREKLRMNSGGNSNEDNKGSDVNGSEGVEIDQSGPSGWFSEGMCSGRDISSSSSEDLVCAEKIKNNNSTSADARKHSSEDSRMIESFREETCEMEKLSDLFKTSMLCAILLWTPAFLEVLSKVFLCIQLEDWLMNISFFAAILFGTVRNSLNLRMIRIRETLGDDCKKVNSVYPSS